MSEPCVLAADIGGTNIRAALVTTQGEIIDEQRTQADLSHPNVSEKDIINTLSDFLADKLQDCKNINAIGIGFPGFFIQHSDVVASSPNLPNIHNFSLASMLEDKLHIPVYAQNDALCAAIGEHRFGAGKGKHNLLHITLGTGIGGGLILNNMPYTGENGMAMEFGHLCVNHNPDARLCGCGNYGCIEAYASATSIAAQYFEKTHKRCSSQDIYQYALSGENDAIEILEASGVYLGQAIAEAIKLLDIHTVSIGGGMVGAWELFYPRLIKTLDHKLISPLKGKINVLPTTLHDNAGILGAASLALKAS